MVGVGVEAWGSFDVKQTCLLVVVQQPAAPGPTLTTYYTHHLPVQIVLHSQLIALNGMFNLPHRPLPTLPTMQLNKKQHAVQLFISEALSNIRLTLYSCFLCFSGMINGLAVLIFYTPKRDVQSH